MTNLHSILIKSHHSGNKGPSNQNYDISSSHYKCEIWVIKKVECNFLIRFLICCVGLS